MQGTEVQRWPLLRFHPRGGSAGARGLDVADDQRGADVVAQWLLDNAPALREALKEAGITTLAELDAASAHVPSALAPAPEEASTEESKSAEKKDEPAKEAPSEQAAEAKEETAEKKEEPAA